MRKNMQQGSGGAASGAAGGFFFAAVLLVLSLLARTELTAVNAELAASEEEIRLLEREREELQEMYGLYMDLEAAENYALEELGLQRRQSGQIRYEEQTRPDRVTIRYVEGRDRLWYWWETCFR